jgi:hypothetical protein
VVFDRFKVLADLKKSIDDPDLHALVAEARSTPTTSPMPPRLELLT